MNSRQRFKLGAGAGLVTMLLGALMALAPGAGAGDETFPESGEHKIDICHRTNAVTNPYVVINVDIDAGNGSIAQGPDHYQHDLDGGGVFDFDAVDLDARYPKPRNGDQWGDIIPPVPLFDENRVFIGMSDGLNWTEEGQAIYNAGCSEPGTDTPDAPVVIVKKTVPDLEVTAPFNFSINGGTSFQVADGGASDEYEVAVGSVTVTEDLEDPSGYELSGVTCSRVSSAFPDGAPVQVQRTNGAVTFSIDNEEIVTCEFTNVPVPTGTAAVSIVKTNDASGDSTYNEVESTTPGADVPFRLVITNTGDVDVTVATLEDSWGQTPALNLLASETLACTVPGEGEPVAFPLAVDSVLTPDLVVTCDFTVEDYAPPSNVGTLTNTVTLDTDETEPVSDTSTVTTQQQIIIVDSSSYSVEIDKRNDANRSGRFSNRETAEGAGDDVLFQITIRNTGTGALVLERLIDVFDGEEVNLLNPTVGLSCPALTSPLAVGSVLAAGSTTVCTFELDGYAPPAGEEIENTVTVDTNRADDSDTSTVRTDDVQVLPAPPVTPPAPPVVTPPTPPGPPAVVPVVQPAPQVKGDVVTRTLPRTGDETRGLAGVGAFMLALGAVMVLGSRRQLARR